MSMAMQRIALGRFRYSTDQNQISKCWRALSKEAEMVNGWFTKRISEGVVPHEICAIVRSKKQFERAKNVIQKSGLAFKVLDEYVVTSSGYLSLSTMHLAKGLEFRAIVVMACDDEVFAAAGTDRVCCGCCGSRRDL